MSKVMIFIKSDVLKNPLKGDTIKRIIRRMDTKVHKHTFLVKSRECFIVVYILYKIKYLFR
jgi:hypothetical protein